jgi:hypothetical protein
MKGRKKGVWKTLFNVLKIDSDLKWVFINSTYVKAHQHSARTAGGYDENIGKGRAGSTSKVHLAVNAYGLPEVFTITGGHVNSCTEAPTLIEKIDAAKVLIADKGYSSQITRRTSYLLADRAPKLKAGLVTDVIIRELRPVRGAVQTLTLDNGSRFANHNTFSKTLSPASYFCDPYQSCQRGSNENTNGLLRQYFPKGTNFAKVSRKTTRQAVNRLNNRPQKRLGYRTPAEVFWSEYSGALETSGAALIT